MSRRRGRRNPSRSRTWYLAAGGIVVVAIVAYLLASGVLGHAGQTSSFSTTSQSGSPSSSGSKPIILYVNQGNGVVNGSNFGQLLSTATSHGFNTVFFQVYRSGTLLFSDSSLAQLASMAHGQGLKIFFALYFTNTTQTVPTSVYSDGEDGISLDMSTLPIGAQTTLFNDLSSGYSGKTAITTTDPSLPLRPDLLVVETYAPSDRQYIRPGIVAGVEVVATSSKSDYESQIQYAITNSDGVMVFDYHGLVKSGY